MNQNGLARLELGVVEQHVLHGCKRDRRARQVAHRDALRRLDDQAFRHVDEIAGKAVEHGTP